MLILQILVAHLLGDFVFQSNELIKRKYESWKGTFQHATIIAFFTTLFLLPYWAQPKAWLTVGIIFVVHFVQDVLKVEYDARFNKNHSTLPFFIDQFCHISLIVLLGRGFETLPTLPLPDLFLKFYFSPTLQILLASVILLSYTLDITIYQFKHRAHQKLLYRPDHKGMLQRVLAFSIFYLILVTFYSWLLAA